LEIVRGATTYQRRATSFTPISPTTSISSKNMASSPTHASILNEDCNIHYWSQGTGPLIILIPNGFGHGSQYNALMTLLSPSYTAATYDRRGTVGSPNSNPNKILNTVQQARDVAAVIKALGHSTAIIFGSSQGGTIAFQFALDFPTMVTLLISHEAPTMIHLPVPACSAGIEAFLGVYYMYLTAGLDATYQVFVASSFKGLGEDGTKLPESPPRANMENFFANELLLGVMYCPDLRKLVHSGVAARTGLLAGRRSERTPTSVTTIGQQEVLGCERMVIAGHHL
jgi:pimeloyl-ACP methyl ester carboxylesterase